MSRVLVGFDETTENRGGRRWRGYGHGFFERLLHKSPFGAIINGYVEFFYAQIIKYCNTD